MKADSGAGFMGTTQTDLEDTFEGDFGARAVIVLKDDTARIYSADAKAYKTATSAAREYLQDTGYTIADFSEDGPEVVAASESEKMPEEAEDLFEEDIPETKT